LERLGVEHIAAYSRGAGRSSGCSHLAGSTGQGAGNSRRSTRSKRKPVLCDVYIPEYNARFAVAAAQEGTAFVAIPGVDLAEILCVQEERQVATIIACRSTLKLQIPESPLRAHFVKTRVKVRQYPDGPMRFSTGRDALTLR